MTTCPPLVSLGAVIVLLALSGCGGSPSARPAAPSLPEPTGTAPASTVPTPARTRATGLDVDGDGLTDTASTAFLTRRTARLVVHLGSGQTLTSKAFPLFHGDGAGRVSGHDVSGQGRDQLFVADPGADGTGYDLFTYAAGAVVQVQAPAGEEAPYLYIGGGMYYSGSFGCASDQLIQAKEQPVGSGTGSMPPDPAFTVTTTSYALRGARLVVGSTTSAQVADRAAAAALLTKVGNGCGASP